MVEPTPLDRALDQVPPDEFVALATSFQNISVDAVDARLVASARVMKEIGVLILEAVGRRPQRDLSDDDITCNPAPFTTLSGFCRSLRTALYVTG